MLRMPAPLFPRILFVWLPVILGASAMRAEVFWRIPRRADSVLQQLGGARVHTTPVQINGAPGTLCAYAFDRSAAEIGAALARQYALPTPAPFAGSLLTVEERGRLRRLLLLPAGDGSEAALVYALDQSLADAGHALRASAPPWPRQLPTIPGQPLFSAVCEATRTSFVTSESHAPPEAALLDATRILLDHGWQPVSPPTPRFALFMSGEKICALFAGGEATASRSTLSLLLREGAAP